MDGFPGIAPGRAARGRKRSDSDVLGWWLLHDDDGPAWRNWFAATGLAGYDAAKHLRFNDSSLALTAALRGQGVALTTPLYLGPELQAGRLVRVGRTAITVGDYWLLEATDRGSAKARAAFVEWLDAETQRLSRTAEP